MLDIDTLKGQLDHASIDLESLLLLYQCYEELSRDATQNIAQVADKLGLNKHKLYRAVDKLQTAAGVGKVFDRRPGQGSRVLDEDRALFDRVKVVLEALQGLLRPGQPSASPPVLRIGIPQVLAVRLFPPMLRHFRAAHPDLPVEIQVVPAHSDELIRMAPQGNLDLVLTFYDDQRAQEDVAARARLRRCLLVPSGPSFAFPPGPFRWDTLRAWLAERPGLSLAVLSHLAATLDLPWQELQTARLTQVPTQIEAQGLVRAGLAIAFGLTELLSEDEERELRVVGVGDSDLAPVALSLLRPQAARRRRTPAENEVIDRLQAGLAEYLEVELPRRRALDADGLTRQVARFGQLWQERPGASQEWLPGRVELAVTPGGCLRGTHWRDDGPRVFNVFGHVVALPNGGLHLLWRGSRPGEQYGAGVVVAEGADHALGTWSGASDGGALVLHDEAAPDAGRLGGWLAACRTMNRGEGRLR